MGAGLSRMHEAADLVCTGSHVEARRALRTVVAWCTDVLEPHMAWEESWLYPQIELLTETGWSTRAARFDHGQIAALIAQLRIDEAAATAGLTPAAAREWRSHLFALEAVVRSHMLREEMLLLPVLGDAEPR